MRLLIAVAVVLLSTTPAVTQEDAGACHGGDVGWVPRELLQRRIGLSGGIGTVDEKVTTASKEAQAFYNQGLAYLHSYVYIEAARSFHEALRHDPGLAMAHLGVARAYLQLQDRGASQRALEKARSLEGGTSARERRRIAIVAAQLAAIEDADNQEKYLAYKKALDEALAADLDDPELWLWRGNAEESPRGRGQRGGVASIAFYERALLVRPGHFGAHHYLIHSYEFLDKIEEALVHGAAYASAADAVPHAHHMYGHDLRRVGRVKDAIAAFERADRLEREYFARENVAPEVDWHHPHNLDLLAGSYRHMGRLRKAEELWRESSSIRPVTEIAAVAKMDLPAFLLSRGRNDDAATEATKLTSSDYKSAQGIGYALLGEAVLAKGDVAGAERHLAAAQKIRDVFAAASPNEDKKMLQVSIDALRGSILVRKGDGEKGRTLLERVQAAYRGLRGPDGWTQALFRLELIARQAREAGDWKFAEFMAKQMLEHDAAYGGTHYALAMVARQRGDEETADREMREAKRLWSEADEDLAELRAQTSDLRRDAPEVGAIPPTPAPTR